MTVADLQLALAQCNPLMEIMVEVGGVMYDIPAMHPVPIDEVVAVPVPLIKIWIEE